MGDEQLATASGDSQRAERIFLTSGIFWQLCMSSYWVLLFTRVTVDLGFPPVQLLLLGTVKEITILLAEIPTGVVADLRSRRTSVILGFFCAGFGVVLAGFGSTFVVVALGQVLWSLGSTFRSGAETAWITDELGSTTAAEPLILRRARLGLLGAVVGVVIGAAVAAIWSMGTALVLVGVVLLARGFTLLRIMPETGFMPLQGVGTPLQQFGELLRVGGASTRRVKPLRRLFIVVALAGFASEAVDRLFVARFDELPTTSIAIDATLVGGISVSQSLLGAAALLLLKDRLRGDRLVPWLSALHLGTAVGVLLLARGNVLVAGAFGVIASGTLRAVARPVVEAWTNAFTMAEHRATVHSFLGQAQSLGEITGGIGLGIVASQFDIATALAVSCAVYVVASILAGLAKRQWQDHSVRAPDITLS